ncbi:MAG: hypothetical protein NTX45_12410 [Proteobacteria bacterium]|nr:hypothetical protein [Pseudomonadota bacterium]
MNTGLSLSVLLALFVVAAIIVVLYVVARRTQRAKTRTLTGVTRSNRAAIHSATGAKTEVERLLKIGAQWPEIVESLNQNNDSRIAVLLHAIRGPHMFNPRTALSVISHGCDVALGLNPKASALSALQAAKDSMEKVTRFGD